MHFSIRENFTLARLIVQAGMDSEAVKSVSIEFRIKDFDILVRVNPRLTGRAGVKSVATFQPEGLAPLNNIAPNPV